METVSAAKKYAGLDLLKWIFTILIMTHHLYHIGFDYGHYHFTAAYRAVEFFFMVTGFLTVKHFKERSKTVESGVPIWGVMQYTRKKFLAYLPFTVPPVFAAYLMDWMYSEAAPGAGQVEAILEESLFLGCVFGKFKNLPLWYLSALLVIFPLFCIHAQKSEKDMFHLSSILVCILGYGWFVEYHGPYADWRDMARALSGVAAGGVAWSCTEYINTKSFSEKTGMLFRAVQILSLVCILWLFYFNIDTDMLINILFFTLIVFSCSKPAWLYDNGWSIFSFLGRLSLPLYTWHWVIGTAMNKVPFVAEAGYLQKKYIYFGGTLAVAMVHLITVEIVRKWWKMRK